MTPRPARGQHFLLLHFKEPVSHGQHLHPLYCCPPVSSQDRCSLMMEEISITIIVILIFICNIKMNKKSILINKVFILYNHDIKPQARMENIFVVSFIWYRNRSSEFVSFYLTILQGF